jgi:hypothetical protein
LLEQSGSGCDLSSIFAYDVTTRSYSFLLGAMVNEALPWSGAKEPRRFGDWSFAQSAVFEPSIIDTAAEPLSHTDGAALLDAATTAPPPVPSPPDLQRVCDLYFWRSSAFLVAQGAMQWRWPQFVADFDCPFALMW